VPTEQSLPLIASLEDLELRVGEIAQEQQDNAESLLRYASNLVRAYGNRLWDADFPEELVEVVVGMVERARDNPTGATQESAGPFTVSWGPNAAQRVYLTRGDRMIVRSVGAGRAFSVVPQPGVGGSLGGPYGDW
jgi:hypothetical protein